MPGYGGKFRVGFAMSSGLGEAAFARGLAVYDILILLVASCGASCRGRLDCDRVLISVANCLSTAASERRELWSRIN